MKSLYSYIQESLKPKADQLNNNQLLTYSFNYIKQWSTGEFSEKPDCSDIEKIDDELLKDIVECFIVSLDTHDTNKICSTLISNVIDAIESKFDKVEIDKRYENIVKVFSKRRIEIMRLGWALGKSNVEIVAQIYTELFRTMSSLDKKRLEDVSNRIN